MMNRTFVALARVFVCVLAAFAPSVIAQPCDPGFFSSTGNAPCDPCPATTFAPIAGLNRCLDCGSGSSSEPGASQCFTCDPGFFSNPLTEGLCVPCPIGTYTPGGNGSFTCADCPLGTTSNPERTACIACPAGFVINQDTGACEPCPASFFAPVAGLTQCLDCGSGSSSEPGSTACFTCDPGFFSNPLTNGLCEPCPANT
ncbi:MAG: hypothetical protein AAGB34_03385, partial [Planctomycetota bacterium]